MAQRRTATQKEKEVIDRLAHAFVCDEIAKEVIEPNCPEHAEGYKKHMRKECPHFYRLLDELQKAIPRVKKQMLAEHYKAMKKGGD
ncbi:hypothetical protein [Ponticaulis sp.]|uniref:hypothetical protein n=1 Tax=Ponticaulis sp. TaxID=2020902 RepID=UPI000C55F4EE|nr:hypothetical protein [Ponticaulis sp.]MBN05146.1 hypothetical protein [Ponticaulis sp.]|tara:strand:+ start:339 stop:596 length:258 start_codon:yes stop_codon:yes gene_type:complete